MGLVVLGAGVVGLTTAWALVERGHRVTIVDRGAVAGLETSFGNGAQLSYAYVAPLASPGLLPKIPGLLLDRNGPIRIRPSLDPAFLRWGLAFLRACNSTTERETTRAQLELAALSRAELMRLKAALDLRFDWAEPGKLVLFRSEASMAAARRQVETCRAWGVDQELASAERCLELEPTLRLKPADLAGGVFTPSEQVGDCAIFCQALAERLQHHPSVSWRLNETIQGVMVEQGRLKAIRTDTGTITADGFVLCLAQGSVGFARSAGFNLPIQPMKGYSVTLPAVTPLTCSVTDFDRKTVFAPLGPMVRVAGVADLVGADRRLDPQRLGLVRQAAQAMLPLQEATDDRPWAGLRPMTPDGRPIVGPSPVAGLFLNTGHGALGWTLACGSARLCADLIERVPPPVRAADFALHR